MSVGLIIPARNEADALKKVLKEIPFDSIHEVIVVDNGSTDNTAVIAKSAGARVVYEPIAGYGRACLAGIAKLSPDVDVVAFMDADHSDYAEELDLLIKPIQEDSADLVIGSRVQFAEAGSLTVPQRFGNALACRLMRWFLKADYSDLGPFRAIRRSSLHCLHMEDTAFGWTVEMQAKAALAGLRIQNVSVHYRQRIGQSKISGTVKGTILAGVGILGTLFKIALGPKGWLKPSRQRLVVFLKAPRVGEVKTRLAFDIGDESATEIYRACVKMTLAHIEPLRNKTILYVNEAEHLADVKQWLGSDWEYRVQQGVDLGERIQKVVDEAFQEGVQELIIVGTDSPWISWSDCEKAFSILAKQDVVVGPTEDGGYYLIGLSGKHHRIFDSINWGTDSVCQQTTDQARAIGLSVYSLAEGYDLDYLEDVERLIETGSGASSDMQWIHRMSQELRRMPHD